MKKIYTFILCLCFSVGFSQSLEYKKAPAKTGSNYYQIVSEMRQDFAARKAEGMSKAEIKAEKQFERWAYYWRDRVDAQGNFPSALLGWYNAGLINADGRLNTRVHRSAQSLQNWTNVGPQVVPDANGYPNYPQMGRLTNFLRFVKVPSNENVLFVSAPDGGIWKSTDNGNTWAPKLDFIAGIGVTDMRSASNDANNPGTIYVSTGDYDADHIKSIGVLKSTDFGETYQSTGLSFSLADRESTSNLIVINDNTVIVGTNQYIKRTTDGGATWTNVFTHNYPDAQIGKFHKQGSNIMCADSWGGLFFSSDNGVTWSTVKSEGNAYERHSVTADAATGIFYVQAKSGQVSTYNPGAITPTLTTLGSPTTNYNPQGAYNMALVVKDGLIISGGVDAINSEDNGSIWYTTLNNAWEDNSSEGSYGHADIHEMGYLDSGYSFWAVNDGGLIYFDYPTRSEEKPAVDYISDGVLITQLYSVAISPQSEDHKIMGNQDNDGYSLEMKDGSLKWVAALAGDGTCTAIDYNNPNIRYLGSQNGGLIRTDSGFANNYDGDAYPETSTFGAPFVWTLKMNSTVSTTLYGGFGDVYKTTNKGDDWTNLNSGAGQIEYIETFGNNVFVIGANGGRKSLNDGGAWSNLVEPEALARMNSISFDQNNTNIVYATVRGYIDGSKVFKSTDGGTTWSNISAGLPNILAKQVVLKQNQGQEILFLGTELGVYYKTTGSNWQPLGQGLPNVIINDIEINYTVEKLVVATYGRGLWEISIDNNTLGVNEETISNDLAPLIYPNPVLDGSLNIKLKSDSDDFNYIMYNVIGGIVKKGTLNAGVNTIDVKNVSAGIYVIRMNSGNYIASQKIVIK
ncbi:T9SS type A sorting domain-containing protein [Psychroserpens sp. SPM9]|uniref:T9SS type A sorting domain-containing protein n=1 Tax=Psychroserpens sp. SPM9 TaxID=2975598 RepID=UPI0021A2CCF4|nr:T9SS type A sorting domain-containing protein [Psychroserpens sp. SPM9]MDG5492950.1 T9SS type A sorting domain-containing protein [Psychroserpens sp. SPM9]